MISFKLLLFKKCTTCQDKSKIQKIQIWIFFIILGLRSVNMLKDTNVYCINCNNSLLLLYHFTIVLYMLTLLKLCIAWWYGKFMLNSLINDYRFIWFLYCCCQALKVYPIITETTHPPTRNFQSSLNKSIHNTSATSTYDTFLEYLGKDLSNPAYIGLIHRVIVTMPSQIH